MKKEEIKDLNQRLGKLPKGFFVYFRDKEDPGESEGHTMVVSGKKGEVEQAFRKAKKADGKAVKGQVVRNKELKRLELTIADSGAAARLQKGIDKLKSRGAMNLGSAILLDASAVTLARSDAPALEVEGEQSDLGQTYEDEGSLEVDDDKNDEFLLDESETNPDDDEEIREIADKLTERAEELEAKLSELDKRGRKAEMKNPTRDTISLSVKIEAALKQRSSVVALHQGLIDADLKELSRLMGEAETKIAAREELNSLRDRWKLIIGKGKLLREREHLLPAVEEKIKALQKILQDEKTRSGAVAELEAVEDLLAESVEESEALVVQQARLQSLDIDGLSSGVPEEKLGQMKTLQKNLQTYLSENPSLSLADRLHNSKSHRGTAAYILEKYAEALEKKDQELPPSREQIQQEKAAKAWKAFCEKVGAGWTALVNSGYSKRLRGINNNREYKPPESVMERLRSTGSFSYNGGRYTVSSSDSAGVSIKRTIPEDKRPEPHIQSYIFHL